LCSHLALIGTMVLTFESFSIVGVAVFGCGVPPQTFTGVLFLRPTVRHTCVLRVRLRFLFRLRDCRGFKDRTALRTLTCILGFLIVLGLFPPDFFLARMPVSSFRFMSLLKFECFPPLFQANRLTILVLFYRIQREGSR